MTPMMPVNKAIGKTQVDLLDYWRIILKRKWAVFSSVTILVVLAAIYTFTATPIYQATGNILIEEPASNIPNIQEILTSGGTNLGFSGSFFKTQLRILLSRTLAERVAKKMNLPSRPEFQDARKGERSLIRNLQTVLSLRWLFPQKNAETSSDSAVAPADPYAYYATWISWGLSVAEIEETSLVNVNFKTSEPKLAADIVNALVDEFIAFTVETRYAATQQTSEFLSEQIAQLRDDLTTKERELQKYGEEKKLLSLSDKDNNTISKFSDLSKNHMDAQIQRIRAENAWRELSNLRVDSLPQFVSNSLIQTLKGTYAQLKNEYAEKSLDYKPEHPVMIQLKVKLDNAAASLDSEIKKAIQSAEAEYRTALKNEMDLMNLLEAQRADVVKMNNNAILQRSLQIDVDNMKMLLNSLSAKQQETIVSARLGGLGTSYVKIVDRALVPEHPISPNKKRNLIVAALLGLILGVGLAFLADFMDNTIKGPEDVEKLTGLGSLGVIPHFSPDNLKKRGHSYSSGYRYRYGGKDDPAMEAALSKAGEIELINHLFPKISIAEDYRSIRTSILFSFTDKGPKTIAFTSSAPQEGKSVTVANLAISFAQIGGKVLAIDADLRKPRLHKIFKVRNSAGLSVYLTGQVSLEEAIQKTAIDNFWLLPCGPHPPNPAELLNSTKMRDLMTHVKDRFDIILIDTPPVLAVIDPVIVCSFVDSTVLIVRTGKTVRKSISRTVLELSKAKAKVIGVIFNDMKIRRFGGDQYSPYFQYEYYQDKSVDETPRKKQPARRG